MTIQKTIIQLPHYGIIKISGPAVADFLQGQLTCDMREINAATYRLTAYCNPQGRMWCIARIWQQQEDYFLHVPIDVLEATAADLRKYGMFAKVVVTILEHYSSAALLGNEAVDSLKPWLDIPTTAFSCSTAEKLTALCVDAQRWLLIAPNESLISLTTTLSQQNWSHSDFALWDLLEIRAGIPSIWKETMGELLPHDVNLPELNAVSFNKGCYKGQEIIARMQYRGQRKKRMYSASCATVEKPIPGAAIVDATQKKIGTVICAASTANNYELLAILPDSAVEQKTPSFIDIYPLKM